MTCFVLKKRVNIRNYWLKLIIRKKSMSPARDCVHIWRLFWSHLLRLSTHKAWVWLKPNSGEITGHILITHTRNFKPMFTNLVLVFGLHTEINQITFFQSRVQGDNNWKTLLTNMCYQWVSGVLCVVPWPLCHTLWTLLRAWLCIALQPRLGKYLPGQGWCDSTRPP
jgi:hypothetical protein